MKPWFKNFKGSIKFKDINKFGNNIYENFGSYKVINETMRDQ